MEKIKESELIINPDGSIYHINLKPEHLAENIILVGDPGRVKKISRYFDKIVHRSQNREMVAHIGYLNQKHLMVMSTGMGTDNIDIVMNELDALVNIDFTTRTIKDKLTSLNIIRLGTSGAIQPDIPIDTFAVSTHGIGFDGLLKFYSSREVSDSSMSETFINQVNWHHDLPYPYIVKCSDTLYSKMADGMLSGITATAPGFYGPQGRVLRIPLNHPDLMNKMQHVNINNERIINFEMETSALYGLGKLLGHNTLTMCAIIANRALNTYSKDHHKPIEKLIETVLERFTK
ncbi:MAG: nucleoside phosphorylase [Bacteroidales bacterium]|nr:nucleoside phosphorylase [Bacteroidales bacterium]